MSTIFDNPRLRQMDESLMRIVQSRCRNRVSNFFMIVMTYLGGGVIWCVWAGFLCGHPATRQLGICCYVSFWSAWLISSQILVAVLLLLTRPPAEGCVAMVLAVLTAYSRIHVGVHYLTDVLGGAVFGSLCAAACYLLLL